MKRTTKPNINLSPEEDKQARWEYIQQKKKEKRQKFIEFKALRTRKDLVFNVWDDMIDETPFVTPPPRKSKFSKSKEERTILDIIPIEILETREMRPKLKRRKLTRHERYLRSLARRGRVMSEEAKANMRLAKQNMTEETKEKIRLGMTGKKNAYKGDKPEPSYVGRPKKKWHSFGMIGRKVPLKKPYVKYSAFTGDKNYRFRSGNVTREKK